ncbi:MAG TPA: hypothetical protein VFV38_35455 [Ktedonobacteraceae bacterium]|nr:hypothetical protein [Ktedonobacteraceae bacterium]
MLDPEGASEVALHYRSPTAEYVFHLPFRQAARFVPAKRLRAILRQPGRSWERGIVEGRGLREKEGLSRPTEAILRDLGVEIARICPHHLEDKQAYMARPAIRDLRWPSIGRDGED